MRERLGLAPIAEAVAQMHYPTDSESLERARRRLAFEELLPIQLTMLLRRRHVPEVRARRADADVGAASSARSRTSLPFTLTGAQERVLFDVLNDLRTPVPMSRLVQGDVGSGKTVIAAAALVAAIENGRQGVMMAPTEILAEQHFRTLKQLFGANARRRRRSRRRQPRVPRAGRCASRCSRAASKAKERRELYEALERGEIDIACGTHALIQGGVRFHDLGVAVVDEQHRFGVMQRAALREKGAQAAHTPHMLVMTATPIPRTLALTLYGDLDISVHRRDAAGPPADQDDVGAARTSAATPSASCATQVEAGRQAFVICPLVEESETLDVKAATAEYERLRAAGLPRPAAGAAARPHVGEAEGRRDAPLPRRRGRHPRVDRGHRSRHRRAERDGDDDRGRRPLRARAAAPVPRARRPRRRAELLPAALRRAERGGAASGWS